jgi:hypothetical protein
MAKTVYQELMCFYHLFYPVYHSFLGVWLNILNLMQENDHRKGYRMKNIIVALSILIILFPEVYAMGSSNNDSTESVLYGLYGTYPVLSKEKRREILEKKHCIATEIKVLEDSLILLNETIEKVIETDTVTIRDHTIFLGGMFTIPVLTEAEKLKKNKLEPLKKGLQAVKEHKAELEQELVKLNDLLERDRKFFEKRILWGFIVWEEEK